MAIYRSFWIWRSFSPQISQITRIADLVKGLSPSQGGIETITTPVLEVDMEKSYKGSLSSLVHFTF